MPFDLIKCSTLWGHSTGAKGLSMVIDSMHFWDAKYAQVETVLIKRVLWGFVGLTWKVLGIQFWGTGRLYFYN